MGIRGHEGRDEGESKMSETQVKHTIPIAEDLHQTLELMAEEHGFTIDEIVDTIFRMAFEAKSLEEILEDLKDGQNTD